MSLIKYMERVRRIDTLVNLRATGAPEKFANSLGIGRSTLFQNLQELRHLGVDIKYSPYQQTYYYANNRRIKISIENI